MQAVDWEARIKHLQKIKPRENTTTSTTHKCDICRDIGFVDAVDEKGHSYAKPCICRAKKMHELRLEYSGISEFFLSKNFNNFVVKNKEQESMKNRCLEYAKSQAYEKSSLALLGNVGSGKTHLAMAVSNYLINIGVNVMYVDYRGFITRMKQSMIDRDEYELMIRRVQNVEILFIDDFYKGNLTKTDPSIMFEVINYRYFSKKPIILTSEMDLEDIIDVDEGVGSRIREMSEGFVIRASSYNYRLRR